MDHTQAVQTQAADRYLLGELSDSETQEFEEHYFGCPDCAADLESGAILVENSRVVLRETRPAPARLSPWRRFIEDLRRPAFAIPSFAACALAFVCAWQGLLVIPQLQQEAAAGHTAMALPTFALAGHTRGAESALVAPRNASFLAVSFDLDPQATYPQYRCELQNAAGASILTVMAAPPAPGEPVTILLPARALKPGNYRLVVSGIVSAGAPPARISDYSFTLEFK